jgi:hypothetical protein
MIEEPKDYIANINPDCKFLIYLLDQLLKGYSPIVLVCGRQRAGKSSFALMVAIIIHWIFYRKNYPIKEYVYFNAFDFIKKTISVTKKIVIIDEATKDLAKTEWYSIINQVVAKIIETQAYLTNIYIIVMPHASRLAPQHKIYIDLKIVMKYRGVAKIFFLDKDYGELSGDIKRIVKNRWFGIWQLPKPPKRFWDLYDKYSKERKREIAQEEIGRVKENIGEWVCGACEVTNIRSEAFCKNCGVRRA